MSPLSDPHDFCKHENINLKHNLITVVSKRFQDCCVPCVYIEYLGEKKRVQRKLQYFIIHHPHFPDCILDTEQTRHAILKTVFSQLIVIQLCYLGSFWRRSLPTHRFVCPPVCLFQLASGEVSLTILTSTIVGEYRRVFNNYPGPKNEQCHTQTVQLG